MRQSQTCGIMGPGKRTKNFTWVHCFRFSGKKPRLNRGIVEVASKPSPTAHRSQRLHWRGRDHGICTFSNGPILIAHFLMHTRKQSVRVQQEKYPYPAKLPIKFEENPIIIKCRKRIFVLHLFRIKLHIKYSFLDKTCMISWVIPVRSVQKFVNSGFPTGFIYSWNLNGIGKNLIFLIKAG